MTGSDLGPSALKPMMVAGAQRSEPALSPTGRKNADGFSDIFAMELQAEDLPDAKNADVVETVDPISAETCAGTPSYVSIPSAIPAPTFSAQLAKIADVIVPPRIAKTTVGPAHAVTRSENGDMHDIRKAKTPIFAPLLATPMLPMPPGIADTSAALSGNAVAQNIEPLATRIAAQITQSLANTVQTQPISPISNLQFQLNPPHLGQITIMMHVVSPTPYPGPTPFSGPIPADAPGMQTNICIVTQTAGAQHMLAAHGAVLGNALNSCGISMGSLNVDLAPTVVPVVTPAQSAQPPSMSDRNSQSQSSMQSLIFSQNNAPNAQDFGQQNMGHDAYRPHYYTQTSGAPAVTGDAAQEEAALGQQAEKARKRLPKNAARYA